jgi:hypothetical protein
MDQITTDYIIAFVSLIVTVLISLYVAKKSATDATSKALQAWQTSKEVEDAKQTQEIELLKEKSDRNESDISLLSKEFHQHQLNLPKLVTELIQDGFETFFSKMENLLLKNNEQIHKDTDKKISDSNSHLKKEIDSISKNINERVNQGFDRVDKELANKSNKRGRK